MSDRRKEAAAVRRYLREEMERGRGDVWEVVLSEAMRAKRGEVASAAGGNPGSGARSAAPATRPAESPKPRTAENPKPPRPTACAARGPSPDPEAASLLFDLPGAGAPGPGEPLEGDSLEQVATEVRGCVKCGLQECRTQAVPGAGSGESGIVFVGEAPGREEDRRGEPFVGRAGELLTRILAAVDEKQLIPGVPINRETVYICNVLKCRPPENRNPLPHEIETCSPYLQRQLALLRPKIICCLGKFAAELLVGVKGSVGSMRGKTYRFGSSKLIVTYHPAACLRNPNYKRPVWEDMQRLAEEYRTA